MSQADEGAHRHTEPGAPSAPRPLFSVCIPAYNRVAFLEPLLQSILQQDFSDYEIVIAEDHSPQREQILAVASALAAGSRCAVRVLANGHNLGYDGNIRHLVSVARGRYCFFMGNDDLMTAGALGKAAACLQRHPGAGMLLRAYAWFDHRPEQLADTVRYVAEETWLAPGAEALALCYRRSGIISGYVVDRDLAQAAATDRFDGTLFYQMHLTASVLCQHGAVVTPEVLVLCRASEAPDFGSAPAEQGIYQPGRYTPQARQAMVAGALRILKDHAPRIGEAARGRILRDYARHFYPFLRDQLGLPLKDYLALCQGYARLDLGRFPSFYLNCIIPFVLGQRLTDQLLHSIRQRLGHTPRLS